MNPRAANRLRDALDSARTVEHFVTGQTFSSFIESRLVRSAVKRVLESFRTIPENRVG